MVISDRQMGHPQLAGKSGALSCRLMHSCSAMDRHMQHAVFHTIAFLAFSCLAFSTPTAWCRIFMSRNFMSRIFSVPCGSDASFRQNSSDHLFCYGRIPRIAYWTLRYVVGWFAVVTTRPQSASISLTANVTKTTRRLTTRPSARGVSVEPTIWTAVVTTVCHETAAGTTYAISAPAIRIGRRRTAITRATTSTDTTQATTATIWSSTAADTPPTISATPG